MYTRFASLFLALACLAPAAAFAQNPENGAIDYDTARLERRLKAAPAQGRIELDGRLDEPSWAQAPLANNFVQNDPDEGKPAVGEIKAPDGTVMEKAGAVRDGGSFEERMGKVACWNSVMDEDRYMVRRWNEFIAA